MLPGPKHQALQQFLTTFVIGPVNYRKQYYCW
jgi:hypothetical protein